MLRRLYWNVRVFKVLLEEERGVEMTAKAFLNAAGMGSHKSMHIFLHRLQKRKQVLPYWDSLEGVRAVFERVVICW